VKVRVLLFAENSHATAHDGNEQAAEKLSRSGVLYQGTTSVLPQMPQARKGFSPCGTLHATIRPTFSVFPQPLKTLLNHKKRGYEPFYFAYFGKHL
jgi:hypothetical protein